MNRDEDRGLLRDGARRLLREFGVFQSDCKGSGLTHAQIHILVEVEKRGQVCIGDLATILNVDASSMSRTVARMVDAKLLSRAPNGGGDQRRRPVVLSAGGRKALKNAHRLANGQVDAALDTLRPDDQAAAVRGVQIYARALERVRRINGIMIREIETRDDPAMTSIIVDVMASFGAVGEGYSVMDAETRAMSKYYRGKRSRYFVVEQDGRLIGGAGVAHLEGAAPDVCELRKMYFLPEARGLGLGRRMLTLCLATAREMGYRVCYLETLSHMNDAVRLYESSGFARLAGPMGATGHSGCNRYYSLPL